MSSASVSNLMMAGPVEDLRVPRSWIGQVLLQTLGTTGARVGLVWIIVVAFCAVFAPLLANSFPIVAKVDGTLHSSLYQHLTPTDAMLMISGVAGIVLWRIKRLTVVQKLAILLWVLLVMVPLASWKPLGAYLLSPPFDYDPSLPAWRKPTLWRQIVYTGAALGLGLNLLAIAWLSMKAPLSMKKRAIVAGSMAAVAAVLIVWPINPPSKQPTYETYRELSRAGRVQWALHAPIRYSPTDRLRDPSLPVDVAQPHPWAPGWAYSTGAQWNSTKLPQPKWHDHLMGTEVNGADIASNMIHACRIAMSIGFISTGIAVVIAIIVGGMMGYFVGWVDLLGMRLVEIFAAIPTLYLLLALVAFFGRNLYLMMVIIGLTAWVGKAYFVRAEFLKLRNQDFVQAAVAAGLPLRSVLFKHLLPNALAPLLVSASFSVASAILAESALSFLGLGLVDEPSWGRLLDMARGAGGGFHWWLGLFPGLAIFLTVLSYNLIGEAFRDAIDPRTRAQGQ